ncbi:MAG: FdtA/QdtA family cupin domain-containing protein [Gallionellaceae bacterium]
MTQVNVICFPRFIDLNGDLCVYECGKEIPFDVRRIFTVSAIGGDIRGDHAHKRCSQLLVCVSGQIRVLCDNGLEVSHYILDSMNRGLIIPPGIWARQEYITDGAVLMVLCDRGYEEDDYIREYEEFKKYFEK